MISILTVAATLTVVFLSNFRLASSRVLDVEQKISHGCFASFGEHPIAVRLNIFLRVTPRQCAGSIISPNLILTAAHCIDGIPKLISGTRRNGYSIDVVAGATGWDNQGFRDTVTQTRKVVEFIRHEQYNRTTRENDLTILILATSFELDERFQAVNLPESNQSFNGSAHICGWGALTEEEEKPGLQIQELQDAVVSLRNGSACTNVFQNTPARYDDRGNICAGVSPPSGTCNGSEVYDSADSGGPLLCTSESKQFLCGIMSWMSECGRRAPVAYTRVSSFANWIQNKIGMHSSIKSKRTITPDQDQDLPSIESISTTETPVTVMPSVGLGSQVLKFMSMIIAILGGHDPDFQRAELL